MTARATAETHVDRPGTVWAPDESIPPRLAMAFAPVHKLALGIALGLTSGALVFGVTVLHVLIQPGADQVAGLSLLGEYFYGYTVSWLGAVVGLFWASISGFVLGWFLGFIRNLTTALWVFSIRTKAELSQPFLDHI